MILQSQIVHNAIDKFHSIIHEVSLTYYEDNAGLHIVLPASFDNLPEVVRLHATMEFNNLMKALLGLGIRPHLEVNKNA